MSETELAPSEGVIDINEVMRLIPHRPPMLLIDRAEEFIPFTSIVGVKSVTVNEGFFGGHFPSYPVMPGVLITEAIAQAGGVLMSKSLNFDTSGKTILLLTIDNCRFRHQVRPGDQLRMPVEVVRRRGNVFRFRGKATVDGKVAAEADFGVMVVETPL